VQVFFRVPLMLKKTICSSYFLFCTHTIALVFETDL
jgi:hypothetical protein